MKRFAIALCAALSALLLAGAASAQSGSNSPRYIPSDLISRGQPLNWKDPPPGTGAPASTGSTLPSSQASSDLSGFTPSTAPSGKSLAGTTTAEQRKRWQNWIDTDGDASVFGVKGDYKDGKWTVDPTIVQASGSAKIDGVDTSTKVGDGTLTAGVGRIEASGDASITPTSVSAEAAVGGSVFHVDYKDDKTDINLEAFSAEAKAEANLDLKKLKGEVGGEVGVYAAKADASREIDIGPLKVTLGVHGAVGAAIGAEGTFDLKKGVAKWSVTTVAGIGGGFDIGFSLPDDASPVVPVGDNRR